MAISYCKFSYFKIILIVVIYKKSDGRTFCMAEIVVGREINLFPPKLLKNLVDNMSFIVTSLCCCGRGHEVLRPSRDPSPKRRLK